MHGELPAAELPGGDTAARPSPGEAFRLAAWVGVVSFGGPAAHIGLVHREVIERRRWVSEADFQQALGACMVLPGPEALQVVIYLGWRLFGTPGALVAGLCFLLPSVALLLLMSLAYAEFGSLPAIAGVLFGLSATVVALIVHAVLRLARRSLTEPLLKLIALVAFVLLTTTHVPYAALLLAAAVAGAVGVRRGAQSSPRDGRDAHGGGAWPALRALAWGSLFWSLPLVALLATRTRGLPVALYLALTRAALLTFGGAYAIVKYVADDFVRGHAWITVQQAITGLALAESTPGPLLIVLQFFGFAAGWNDPSAASPVANAVLCALLASYACFLPSFVLVLAAAPQFAQIAAVPRLGAALRGVTAFVVGVIASLGVTVALAVLYTEDRPHVRLSAAAIALGAAWVLRDGRLSLHWVLLAGALAGVASTWLGG